MRLNFIHKKLKHLIKNIQYVQKESNITAKDLLTLPISLPAYLVGCLAIQLRMIGAIAVLRGYDLSDDKVRTIAFACLVGLNETGLKVGSKMTGKLIDKITGKILIKFNQKVGFRLVTKDGSS